VPATYLTEDRGARNHRLGILPEGALQLVVGTGQGLLDTANVP
jgi:hypothetical protein